MLIDTHCHLHDREFFGPEEAEEIIRQAKAVGVEKIICIGTNLGDSLAAKDFALAHDGVYWTYGVHPSETANLVTLDSACSPVFMGNSSHRRLDDGEHVLKSDKLVAIGEVGLDYHYDGYNREAQIRLFEGMLQLALENNLPVSFHVREAFDDFFAIVKNFPKIRGVIHSFSDNKKNLKRILNETEFYVGVNGMATYSTLPTPPIERILLETDAPFLAPVPHRGEKNSPAYIPEIAKWASSRLDMPIEDTREATTKNAFDLFNL